jgi:hypothetical protein
MRRFGYNLKSDLLLDLARQTGGNYAFIPDASFVGTVFVHAISNALSTFAQSAVLSIELPESVVEGAKVLGANGPLGARQLEVEKTTWGLNIKVGDLAYDQERTFCVLFDKSAAVAEADVRFSLKCVRGEGAPTCRCAHLTPDSSSRRYCDVVGGDTTVDGCDGFEAVSQDLTRDLLRLASVEAITDVLRQDLDALSKKKRIGDVVALLKGYAGPSTELAALATDIEGQVSEAVSKSEYYNRWGKHYLPAIARAHLLQVRASEAAARAKRAQKKTAAAAHQRLPSFVRAQRCGSSGASGGERAGFLLLRERSGPSAHQRPPSFVREERAREAFERSNTLLLLRSLRSPPPPSP